MCIDPLTLHRYLCIILPMTTTEQTKTHGAIYVTIGKNDKPRYWTFGRGRLWPCSAQVAEASFAAGATIYRKQSGVSIWTEAPEVFVG